jgi:hypothetical protein
MEQLSALRTGLGTVTETRISVDKTTSEIDDKRRIEKRFISSQSFQRTPGERIWEITVSERFKPQNLESFYPVTQELYQLLLQQSIHIRSTRSDQRSKRSENKGTTARTKLLVSCNLS